MQAGIVGLGRMGQALSGRLVEAGHEVVGFDVDPACLSNAAGAGVIRAGSLEDLVAALRTPRLVWLMLPAGEPTTAAIKQLSEILERDDLVIDGGNNYYGNAGLSSEILATGGIRFLDVGTSGGIRGRESGFSLMIGGEPGAVEQARPLFESLAPAPDRGWGRVGPVGAGHFVKMVHNGIEYGAMQAYAEGFALLDAKNEFELDLGQIADIWRNGSVVRSWLLDLVAEILADDKALEAIAPIVADSGEGRWTVKEAVDLGVPAPVITLSLLARFSSQDDDGFSDRLLAALRGRFGGHATESAIDSDE